MMKTTTAARFLFLFLVAGLLAAGPAARSQEPALTAHEILIRIDANEVADTQVATLKMIITRGGKRKTKVLEMNLWIQGRDRAAAEVTSGPDKGTRYLKLGDDLWIASREAEKPMKISGHMLRQSMLDSDMSYEDTTNNKPLADRYDAEIEGVEVMDGRTCWVLELKAQSPDETYPLQKLWVDQKTLLPIRQELKAISGMLLKTMRYENLEFRDNRWVPMKMTMVDVLKKDSQTVAEFTSIKFGAPIEPGIISLEFVENVH